MKTLMLAFVFYIVVPALHESSKPVKVCTKSVKQVTHARCAYNCPHMIKSRSAKAFRFFALARTGAGCLIS